jgi:hypothetical protein
LKKKHGKSTKVTKTSAKKHTKSKKAAPKSQTAA